ncbi:uncharacterized protein PG986_011244 [Apiospora aurea]|uniref:2EXR domain-containing protein n=1 Tax=Apiospora aurea TaxID=335848 RepID=A0ABR1Q4I5_9PEZI
MSVSQKTPLFETSFFKPGPGTFHPFARLPIELRRLIWTSYLERQRIITIKLKTQRPPADRPYLVQSQDGYRHSVLLWVNQDARRAARAFFSLCIPCDNMPVPLYCNPEFDTLRFHQGCAMGVDYIADFLPKLVAYDARGVGVLNLALDGRAFVRPATASETTLLPIVGNLHGPALEGFVSVLSRLRCLWLAYLDQGNMRNMGPLDFPGGKVHHNRSAPVFPALQTFERLPVDPRPIESDLGHLATFHDPRRQIEEWRRFEAQFKVHREHPLELRIMLAVKSPCIVDRGTAHSYFERSEETFRANCCDFRGILYAPWGEYLTKGEWEDLRGRLQDAVGFWLFAPQAFEGLHYGYKRVRDLANHPPELCLSDLGS